MSSILTNNSALVALQTLKSVNTDLSKTQNEISTGKKVATAKDNSAIFAISKVMESDVAGFKAISDGLALGQSTVAVASAGSEQIVSTLQDIKQLIVSAQGQNVDHAKIQADIDTKTAQVASIIDGAQFNGANLLKTTVDGTATSLTVLASLDRVGSTGTPSASTISVNTVDFQATLDLATNLTQITDSTTAGTALGEIDAFIQTAVDGAASLGAAAGRLDSQSNFVSKLTDSLTSGIGALVDSNLEESSARLKALQVQQQLATQSLSIANQGPQALLTLFR